MNRRQFTQRISALLAAPVMPSITIGGATAAATLPSLNDQYTWAEFIARIHNKASPAMFQRQLSLDPETAQSVYNMLLKDRVISAPNAMGVSKALNPYARNGLTATTSNAFKSKIENTAPQKKAKQKEKVQDFLEKDSEDVNQNPPQVMDDPEQQQNPEHGGPQDDTKQD